MNTDQIFLLLARATIIIIFIFAIYLVYSHFTKLIKNKRMTPDFKTAIDRLNAATAAVGEKVKEMAAESEGSMSAADTQEALSAINAVSAALEGIAPAPAPAQ